MKFSNSLLMSLFAISLFTASIACEPGSATYQPLGAPTSGYIGSDPYVNGTAPTLTLAAVPANSTLIAPTQAASTGATTVGTSGTTQYPVYLTVKVNPGSYNGYAYSGTGTGALNVGSQQANGYGILNLDYSGTTQTVVTYLPVGSHTVYGAFTVLANGGQYYYDLVGSGTGGPGSGPGPVPITVSSSSTTPIQGQLNLLPC